MKILFLARSLEVGGAERQLVALATGLHQKGHHILVVTLYRGGPLEHDLKNAGITVINVNQAGRWALFLFLHRLILLINREAPDVLHGYLPFPNLLAVFLRPLFPRIRTVWGVRASNMDFSQYDWFWPILFRTTCFFSRYPNLIIVNSNAGRDYHLKHGFPGDKIIVIPNGIDTTYFMPDSRARSQKRAEWEISDSEKVVGLIARIDPMKDHATFLRAAAILGRETKAVRFVCVGDGPELYKSRLRQLVTTLGLERRVIWTGACADMVPVYNALDIAVSSSAFGEGFPNVLGEAMACGVPCVATDVGDSGYIIADGQVIVNPRDPEALSDAIKKALSFSSPARARERIVVNFNLTQLVERTEAALQTLCASTLSQETAGHAR